MMDSHRGLLLLVLFTVIFTKTDCRLDTPGAPVVLVPGDGGSQIEARLDKPSIPHFWCDKTSDWYLLWLNIESLVPLSLECFTDNMRLVYDNTTRIHRNNDGVYTRMIEYGNTTSVEWLNPDQLSPTSYYYHIVERLVKTGYTRSRNIRGAPYDFRKSPHLPDFLTKLQGLIEDTYQKNDARRVVLIGHSMGNLMTLYFLNHQSQAWKKKYIKTFISLSGPYAGAVKTLRLLASGDNMGDFLTDPLTVRTLERSFVSTAWMMPYDTFWNSSEALVITPHRNYTVNDYKQFFFDIGYTLGYQTRQQVEPVIKQLVPPGVEVHCLNGRQVKTPAALQYGPGDFPDHEPTVIWGDGDGTVNLRSLHACWGWQGRQTAPVYHQEFPGVDHLGILASREAIDYITKVVHS